MFPIETKAMMEAFWKIKDKRNKAIRNKDAAKLLRQEKRGWSFVRKMNRNLKKQFNFDSKTPSVQRNKEAEQDRGTRSRQYNLMTLNQPSVTEMSSQIVLEKSPSFQPAPLTKQGLQGRSEKQILRLKRKPSPIDDIGRLDHDDRSQQIIVGHEYKLQDDDQKIDYKAKPPSKMKHSATPVQAKLRIGQGQQAAESNLNGDGALGRIFEKDESVQFNNLEEGINDNNMAPSYGEINTYTSHVSHPNIDLP